MPLIDFALLSYNRKYAERWYKVACEKGEEVQFMISVSPAKGNNISVHMDENRPLDNVIETMERCLMALKDHRSKVGHGSSSIVLPPDGK